MSKYEEIKKAIMLMNGVSDVHYDYSSKTNCYCLHFMKDDRSFYLLSSSNNDCHFYCNYLSKDYWVINYSHYTAKDVIEILEKLFFLLPQYDTDKMIDEMRAFADAINLDYKYADDDDQYEKLASILAEKYINSHHLKNDEYNVLYMVIEHVGINAIVGVSPKRHQRKREQKERKRPKRERKSIVKRNNKKRKRKSRKRK